MKNLKIKTYYNPKQTLQEDDVHNYSKSPLKPALLLEYLKKNHLIQYFDIEANFKPFSKQDFLIAHNQEYVEGFFKGESKHRDCNGLLGIKWTQQYAESVTYANASLYNAILNSIRNPSDICFSPTSGFHHATPEMGALFCPFSGQVIASMKIYHELGLSGCYIDLDGHFGNSIEDSRKFVKDLDKAIPKDYGNINIRVQHEKYIETFAFYLEVLEQAIIKNKINYIVFCHGADSHEEDDIGHQCSTEEWLLCSTMFYEFIKKTEEKIGNQIPVSLSLFGGYRDDHFESVLSLHTSDLVTCLNILCGHSIAYYPAIKKNLKKQK